MELGEFLDLRPNERWIKHVKAYDLPEPIVYHDIKIYNEQGIIEGLAESIRFKRMCRGARAIFTPKNQPEITLFNGLLEGIKWLHCDGPRGAYYNGVGWWVPGMTIKWEDGEAMFKGSSYIGFLDGKDHQKYTIGSISMKLYS